MTTTYNSMEKVSGGLRSLLTGSPKEEAEKSTKKSDAAPEAANNEEAEASTRTFTVDDVVEHFGCGWFQIKIIMVSGVLIAADAMEMMLLAVLGPVLRCEWRLTSAQVAMLTTFVFVGMFAGAPSWGSLADKCGRKVVVGVSAALIGYFGLLCSMAPSYTWVVILRSLIGFNIGGGSQCYTLLSEYLPQGRRVCAIVANFALWGCGGMLQILVAWAVLPTLGWRYLAAFSALPVVPILPLLAMMPESLRYLLASGQEAAAEKVMQQMAKDNSKPPLKGRLVVTATSETERGHVTHLFHSTMRRTSLTLFPLWFGVAFTYYGVVLLSSDVDSFKRRCYLGAQHHLAQADDTRPCCRELRPEDFKTMLLSTVGELVILPLNLILLDTLGRRVTIAVLFAASSILAGLISVCVPHWATMAFLFLARGCAAALFNCCYVYTAEVYPTSIRSLGLGVNSAVARIGSMLTPLVTQVLLPDVSAPLAFAIYIVLNLVCSALALSLPIETKGRAMRQSVSSDNSVCVDEASPSDTKTD